MSHEVTLRYLTLKELVLQYKLEVLHCTTLNSASEPGIGKKVPYLVPYLFVRLEKLPSIKTF